MKANILDFGISCLLSVAATFIVKAINGEMPELAVVKTCVAISIFVGAAMTMGRMLGRREA